MKASKAKKLTDKVLKIFNEYAGLAQGWAPPTEDDYDELVNSIMDEIGEFKE